MFDKLLPAHAGNTYRGYKLAVWIFAVVVFLRVVMSLNSMFNTAVVASSADGIPLDTYPTAPAQTIVTLFALLGLANFVICLLCTLVLFRYRGLIPLMFGLLLLQQVGGRVIHRLMPIARNGTPPGFYVNLLLLSLMLGGFVLSVAKRSAATAPAN